MSVLARGTGRCASCVLQAPEWLAPSLRGYDGYRPFSASQAQWRILHRASHIPRRNVNPHSREDRDNSWEVNRTEKLLRERARHQGERTIIRQGSFVTQEFSKYAMFEKLLTEQCEKMLAQLSNGSAVSRSTLKAWGIKGLVDLKAKGKAFRDQIQKCLMLAERDGIVDKDGNYLFSRLRTAFVNGNVDGLVTEMRFAFMSLGLEQQYHSAVSASQKSLSDLRYPTEWYPATRALQRKIHLHVGPTNSGKTYHALQRLEAAESGVYAGPLRLLAHEVYTRLNAKGKPCALITGEERRVPENMTSMMSSCTVEMAPLTTAVDVAVIDEIQMLGDIDRGWAWSQALLGIRAREVHLCGEVRTVPLIKNLCALMGEPLEIHEYKRLSPLHVEKKCLDRNFKNLEKGDAIILFSRVQIHAMKNTIEKETGRRCAMVYGSLPPETRAQQASLFNDPDNDYDFLVASDAVGMGLNLSIKRIIFETTWKYNGTDFSQLDISSIKQIAGRAGRYKSARDAIAQSINLTDGEPADIEPPLRLSNPDDPAPTENVGWVTTLDRSDLGAVRSALNHDAKPLDAARILPPQDLVVQFAAYFPPSTPLSYILLRFQNISTLGSSFKLCRLRDQIKIADLIQPYKLSLRDRLAFCASPAPLRDLGIPEVVKEFAKCVQEQSSGHILDFKSITLELLGQEAEKYPEGREQYLRHIESLHKAIGLYLWLSYRLPGTFQSQALAFHIKDLVETKINECLEKTEWDEAKAGRARAHRMKLVAAAEKKHKVRDVRDLGLTDETNMEVVGSPQVTTMNE